MAQYRFSETLAAFLRLAIARMHAGLGAVLLLEGAPGGGKTSFARAAARELGEDVPVYYYAGSPDKERDLLYEIDVEGVLRRERAWVPGPAWQAFATSSQGRFAVLLIDEVDKTSAGFDAFLLRLLEEWTFRAPDGTEVNGDASKLVVVMTSNGRRKLRPEVLRRCQRVPVPLPNNGRLRDIVRQLAQVPVPDGLVELVIRIGNAVREKDEQNAPSPKELALCCVDLLALAAASELSQDVWREIAASWLTKAGGPATIDAACSTFKWVRALMQEARG